MSKFKEPEAYLKSGSNELKILEYVINGLHLGINILKVNRILERPERLVKPGPGAHHSVMGMFEDHGRVIPLVNLGVILGLNDSEKGRRVIITEFFNEITGFLVDSAEQVYTLSWSKVKGSEDVMGNFDNPYVLAIARPTEDQNILLVDYEKIVLELAPNLAEEEFKADKSDGEWECTGKNILIAEDSTTVRNMLQMELEDLGMNIIAARDGEEAIDTFDRRTDLDLVIADVEMPKRDGLAVLSHIRQNPDRGKTPVIIYSSIGDLGMKERARSLEANAHITKLEMDSLFDTVKEILCQES
ncbi:MAG: Chemotaxis protein cheV [Candidatus Magnetoglobus multicellularis str. Araruama]|uniref:Chemotaxis protein cheV n=1 Tax=Candidatus Magnetoglobus multicellularis str. Araruama TaxID=890399 RepID=A0A1V1P2Y0_9BACT|nr:MAG: Chemotaxis protein cheV [Candidatus Magnetoglobus multicellularis str. Araruama]